MKSLLTLGFIILSITACSTPTENDKTPPTVTITYPLNGAIVSEITEIKCMATDNEGIDYVELWIDGEPTNVLDKSEPYSLPWNTTTYDDSTNHTVIVRAYDKSKNIKDSDPKVFIVDNSNSSPNQVNIISINYNQQQMEIKWSKSNDNDFKVYELYKSVSLTGTKSLLTTITDVLDTIYIFNNFDPTISTYYWTNVIDQFDYNTFSSGFHVKDPSPITPQISSTNYQNNTFKVLWPVNNENDFASYTLYESTDGTDVNETQIFQTSDRNENSFNVQEVGLNEMRFYRIKVKDYWGQETYSSKKRASSYPPIVFYSNHDIFIVKSDGSDEVNLTNDNAYDFDPQITPDGMKIVFVSERDGNREIYSMNIDGTDQKNLSNSLASDRSPQISPDGSKIVFLSDNILNITDINGDNKINLATASGSWGAPKFSLQGDKIVFGSDNQIYVINIDGSNLKNLSNNNRWNSYPDYSPDGLKIVFQSDTLNGIHDVFIMDSDGSNKKNLTKDTGNDWKPKFIPDGTKIIFESRRDLNYEIFVMELDGSEQINLTNDVGVNDFNPHFSSDQLKIVYESGGSIRTMHHDGSDKFKVATFNVDAGWHSNPKFKPVQ